MTINNKATNCFAFGLLALTVGACAEAPEYKPISKDIEDFVSNSQVGDDPDYWIEMRNSFNEWEKVGLIFGYYGDREECEKAISGLKSANDAREYRCSQANGKPRGQA